MTAFSQAAIVMLLAKVGSPEAVGKYALALAIATPVFQFCGLQLRTLQVTDVRNKYALTELIGMRLITTLAGMAVIIVVASGQHDVEAAAVVIALGFAKAIESLSDLCQGIFQKNERMEQVAISLIFKNAISLAGVALALGLGGGVLVASLALVMGGVITLIGYDIRTVVRHYVRSVGSLYPKLDWCGFRELLILMLPLGAVMMLMSLNSNIPRYFLAKYSGEASVGVFSAILYCLMAENMVMAALGQAASPRLAKIYVEGSTHSFCLLVGKIALFGGAVGALGFFVAKLAGTEILTVLYRSEYALHVDSLIWLMLAGVFLNVSGIFGVALTAMQAFKPQVWIHFLCAICGFISSLLLVPSRGVRGAALSIVIMSAVGLAGFSVLFAFVIAEHRAQVRVASEARL